MRAPEPAPGTRAEPKRARPAPAVAAGLVVTIALIHPPAGLGVSLCPSAAVLNTPCPACGLTRSLSSAARGEIVHSLAYHPFGVFVLAGAFAVLAAAFLPVRWTSPVREWIAARAVVLGLIGLLALLAFGVIRMSVG